MSVITMKSLLEAGVHFGHQTRRWNPKMAEFIFTERNGIYIIDLQKTVKQVEQAYSFIKSIVEDGGRVMFVGTKTQAQEAIESEAKRCEMPYVNQRWLGGMMTNYQTIKKSIDRLAELEGMEEDGTFNALPKKEVIELRHEIERLEKFMGGIKNFPDLPQCLFVIDPKKEYIAVREARTLGIPVIGVVDTNCDPEEVDIPIPANDDAIRSVKLITETIANAVIEAKQGEQYSSPYEEESEDIDQDSMEAELNSSKEEN